jgi:hypothetical protein
LSLITRDAAIDRDVIRRGGKPEQATGDAKLVFRPMWVEDRDNVILKVLFNYFSAVADTFPREWNDGTCPLAKTIGFGALMSLLTDLVPAGLKKSDLSGPLVVSCGKRHSQ